MTTPIYCVPRKRASAERTTGSWGVEVTAPSIHAEREARDTLINIKPVPEPAPSPRRPVIGLASPTEGESLAAQVLAEHLRLEAQGVVDDHTAYVCEPFDVN